MGIQRTAARYLWRAVSTQTRCAGQAAALLHCNAAIQPLKASISVGANISVCRLASFTLGFLALFVMRRHAVDVRGCVSEWWHDGHCVCRPTNMGREAVLSDIFFVGEVRAGTGRGSGGVGSAHRGEGARGGVGPRCLHRKRPFGRWSGPLS